MPARGGNRTDRIPPRRACFRGPHIPAQGPTDRRAAKAWHPLAFSRLLDRGTKTERASTPPAIASFPPCLSIPLPLVHHAQQRLAGDEPPHVLAPQPPLPLRPLRRLAAQVRADD